MQDRYRFVSEGAWGWEGLVAYIPECKSQQIQNPQQLLCEELMQYCQQGNNH